MNNTLEISASALKNILELNKDKIHMGGFNLLIKDPVEGYSKAKIALLSSINYDVSVSDGKPYLVFPVNITDHNEVRECDGYIKGIDADLYFKNGRIELVGEYNWSIGAMSTIEAEGACLYEEKTGKLIWLFSFGKTLSSIGGLLPNKKPAMFTLEGKSKEEIKELYGA